MGRYQRTGLILSSAGRFFHTFPKRLSWNGCRADFEDGDFVWFTYTQSKDYGEAFVSETALRRIIGELGLPVEVTTEVTTFDSSSFVQDVFILRRLES